MDYTVPGGKMNRGLSVIDTLEEIYGRSLTDDERFKASILGWTIEWVWTFQLLLEIWYFQLQAFFLVADDLMDGSHTRRGEPCWFRLPGVCPHIQTFVLPVIGWFDCSKRLSHPRIMHLAHLTSLLPQWALLHWFGSSHARCIHVIFQCIINSSIE